MIIAVVSSHVLVPPFLEDRSVLVSGPVAEVEKLARSKDIAPLSGGGLRSVGP